MNALWGSAVAVAIVVGAAVSVEGATSSAAPRRLVLEEQRIEGKIRRPQLVLIKADQRPPFEPIVVHGVTAGESITRGVSRSVIEKCPYHDPFQFAGTRVVVGAP